MAEIVLLPQMGKYHREGAIDRWKKKEGDPVQAGEPLFDCRFDKSEMTVAARASGILLKILLEEMVSVPVLTPVAVIGAPGEDPDAALAEWKKAHKPA